MTTLQHTAPPSKGPLNKGLERASLAEQVAASLSERIASGELAPGGQLPSEGELIATFGVARTVVREAIAKLKALGVVEVYHGKGAFVSALPLDVLLLKLRRLSPERELLPHVWEMRELLETRIAALAAERRDEADLRRLEGAVADMADALARGELGAAEDEAFHRHLTSAAKNPVLEQVMLELAGLIAASRRSSLERPERPGASNAEHTAILAAVRAGDADGASRAMALHLRRGFVRPGSSPPTP